MTTTPHIPTQGELIAYIGQYSNREVLGQTEVTSVVRTLIIPLLQSLGYDTADLGAPAAEGDITLTQEGLGRFVKQEERALIDQMAIADAGHWITCESLVCRAAGVKLMRLLVEMPVHQPVTA